MGKSSIVELTVDYFVHREMNFKHRITHFMNTEDLHEKCVSIFQKSFLIKQKNTYSRNF